MTEGLKDRTVKGTFWSAMDAVLGQGVAFIVGLVLARLLSPAEYGLVGICLIFTTILSGIVDSGFSNALIRKTDTTKEDYNTMFFTNLALSTVLFILLYVCAPAISVFFNHPELVKLVRTMGLILIFQALSLVQNTILTKRIDFKTKTKASAISAILSGVLGISLAFSGFGVWALVVQQLSRQIIYTVCLWFFNKWWPKFQFSILSFRYMWGFGWKMMLSGLLNNIWNQLYQVVVGKYYSPATLGQYTRAEQYASIFSSNLTSIVQRVSFPVLSELQDETERLVSGYRRIIKITMFVTAVSMILMGAIAEPLVYCLIGPQWHEAATYLPYICILMSLYPLQAINLNMLQVQGRSDLFLVLEVVKKVLAIGPLCLGVFAGIFWMLIGSIVCGIISFFLNSYYTGKSLRYTSWMQLRDVAPCYGVAITIAVSVFFLKYLPLTYWIILPLQLVIGGVVFFVLCESIQLHEYLELKGIIKTEIEKMKQRRRG